MSGSFADRRQELSLPARTDRRHHPLRRDHAGRTGLQTRFDRRGRRRPIRVHGRLTHLTKVTLPPGNTDPDSPCFARSGGSRCPARTCRSTNNCWPPCPTGRRTRPSNSSARCGHKAKSTLTGGHNGPTSPKHIPMWIRNSPQGLLRPIRPFSISTAPYQWLGDRTQQSLDATRSEERRRQRFNGRHLPGYIGTEPRLAAGCNWCSMRSMCRWTSTCGRRCRRRPRRPGLPCGRRGGSNFVANVTHESGQAKPVVEVVLQPHERNVSIDPVAFPYRLENINGQAVITDGRVDLRNIAARHGRADT